ncbi:unnamed protein product [Prorocentrum cordatum]|uniref:Uncharacterized protein n=1 Tax=Prorocentrum cordatum TaxID=2364126 RepID=A0ABN9TXK5_9DINO|nr:unnamed protein product [Polarella glacialis]
MRAGGWAGDGERLLEDSAEDTSSVGASSCEEVSSNDDTEECEAFQALGDLEDLKRKFEHGARLEGPSWEALSVLKAKWSALSSPSEGNPDTLFQMLRVLGPEAARLMRALSVRIHDSGMIKGRSIQWVSHRAQIRIAHGRLDPEDWEEEGDGCRRNTWSKEKWMQTGPLLEAIAPRYDKKGVIQRDKITWRGGLPGCQRYTKVKVDVHWSGMRLTDDAETFLKMCNCVSEVSQASRVFETPLGAALVHLAKLNSWHVVFVERIFDFTTVVDICIIHRMSFFTRLCPYTSCLETPHARGIQVFNIINISHRLIELWTCWKVFGTFRPVLTPYCLFNWLVELVISLLPLRIMWEDLNGNSPAVLLCEIPVGFAFVTLAKWVQFSLKIMTTDIFVDQIIHALHAVLGHESLSFIFSLILLSVGPILAYMSLPVQIGWSELRDEGYFAPYKKAMTQILPMILLGDVDQDHLAGYTQRVNSTDGSIQTVRDNEHLKENMPTFMIVSCFIFSVILLNLSRIHRNTQQCVRQGG